MKLIGIVDYEQREELDQAHYNKVRLPIVSKYWHIVTHYAVDDFNGPWYVNYADIVRHYIWLQIQVLFVNV